MNPVTFVETIYLGDRFCKKIVIDSWNRKVSIQVNQVSRIRNPSGSWNFYTDEDIEDGSIVLSEVEYFSMSPEGLIPNDYIECEVELLHDKSHSLGSPKYLFTFHIGCVNAFAHSQQVTIKIIAEDIHLEDPGKPGILIKH